MGRTVKNLGWVKFVLEQNLAREELSFCRENTHDPLAIIGHYENTTDNNLKILS